jgi:hypothetical protein
LLILGLYDAPPRANFSFFWNFLSAFLIKSSGGNWRHFAIGALKNLESRAMLKVGGACVTTSGRREARDRRGHHETDRSGQFNIGLGPRATTSSRARRELLSCRGDRGWQPGEMLPTSANQCHDSTLVAIAENSRRVMRLRKSRSGGVVREFRVGLSLPKAWAFLARHHLFVSWSEVRWILYRR